MKRYTNHIIALLLPFIIVLLLNLCTTIVYETNDDVALMQLVSGGIDGIPQYRMIFSHVSIGFVLSNLYSMLPDIEWYSVYISSLTICGLSIILFSFLSKFENKYKIAVTLLVLIISFKQLYLWQFTNLSALLAIAGVCIAIPNLQSEIKTSNSKLLIGLLLISLSFMVRQEMGMLILGLIFPFSIQIILSSPLAKKRTLWFMLITVLLLAVIKMIDIAFYTSADWEYYLEFNKARGKLFDSNLVPIYQEYLLGKGVDRNAISLFFNAHAITPEFSVDLMQETVNATQSEIWRHLQSISLLKTIFSNVFFWYKIEWFVLLCCLIMSYRYDKKITFWALFCSITILLTASFYFAIVFILKERVFHAAFLGILITWLITSDWKIKYLEKKGGIKMPIFLMLLITSILFVKQSKYFYENSLKSSSGSVTNSWLDEVKKEELYFETGIPKNRVPFTIIKELAIKREKKILPLGWLYNHPLIRAEAEKYTESSINCLNNTPHSYFISDNISVVINKKHLPFLERYLVKNYPCLKISQQIWSDDVIELTFTDL